MNINVNNLRGIVSPYDTKVLSKVKDMKVLKSELSKLAIGLKDPLALNYDLNMGSEFNALVITGKSDAEKDIMPFDLPVMIEVGKGDRYVCCDIREYIRTMKIEESIESYDELMKCVARVDSVGVIFRMMRVMSVVASGEWGKVPKDELMGIYSWLVSGVMNSIININNSDLLSLRVLLAGYIYVVCSEEDVNSIDGNALTNIIINKLGLALSRDMKDRVGEVIMMLLSYMSRADIRESESLEGICAVAKELYVEEVGKFFTPGLIHNQLKTIWFGPGKVEASLGFVENIPLMIALFESGLGVSTFKSTKMANMLGKYKNLSGFKGKEFLEKVNKNFKYR